MSSNLNLTFSNSISPVIAGVRLPSFTYSVGCNKTSGVKKDTYSGNHVYTAPETSEYIMKEGVSEYKLVVSYTMFSDAIMLAVEEFNNVFSAIYIAVPAGCCMTIGVRNISTIPVNVQNANLIVERVA